MIPPPHQIPKKFKAMAVEISLTNHCNLKCIGCTHASPHLSQYFTPPDIIDRDLKALAKVVEAGELRIAGGEPLLHPKLTHILELAKKSRLAKLVVVITNGVLLKTLPNSFWKLIDRMWISKYPQIHLQGQLDTIKPLAREHGVKIWEKKSDTFYHTMLNDRNEDKELVQSIYNNCRFAHEWSCFLVHKGRFYKCPQAAFMEERLGLKGVRFANKEKDSVDIHNDPNLSTTITNYIKSKDPLEACSYCLGTSGRLVKHRMLNKDELKEELTEDHSNPRELLGKRGNSIPKFIRLFKLRRAINWIKWYFTR